jgi:hypothetical protein
VKTHSKNVGAEIKHSKNVEVGVLELVQRVKVRDIHALFCFLFIVLCLNG